MSSYVNFYLRVNDVFAPIGSYSRNSEIYKAIEHYSIYGKIIPLKYDMIKSILEDIEQSISNVQATIQKDNETCHLVMSSQNSLAEKLDTIHTIKDGIADAYKLIEELQFAYALFHIYEDILDEIEYGLKAVGTDSCHYIYFGIDACGTLEDIAHE